MCFIWSNNSEYRFSPTAEGLIRMEKGVKARWRKIKRLFLHLVYNGVMKTDFPFIDFYMIGSIDPITITSWTLKDKCIQVLYSLHLKQVHVVCPVSQALASP